jgi:hypothetical protein
LAAAYVRAGREQEARAEAEEVLKIDPNFSVENWTKNLPYIPPPARERWIDVLRKAGLPD